MSNAFTALDRDQLSTIFGAASMIEYMALVGTTGIIALSAFQALGSRVTDKVRSFSGELARTAPR